MSRFKPSYIVIDDPLQELSERRKKAILKLMSEDMSKIHGVKNEVLTLTGTIRIAESEIKKLKHAN